MEILFLVFIALFLGLCTFVSFKYAGSNALYVVAIGCAVASNVYNIDALSIDLLGMKFGIDSIAYTGFVFCVFLMQLEYGKKDALTLTYCTIGSICLTGLFKFLSDWISLGIDTHIVWGFVSYLVSALATYVAIYACVKIFEKLKVNNYIKLIIYILVASLINSVIYFGLMAVLTLSISTDLVPMLTGSYLGKLIALAFCLLAFALYAIDKNKGKKGKDKMEKSKVTDFDNLHDCFNLDADEDLSEMPKSLEQLEQGESEEEATETESFKLRNHFLQILPEGYTKEEIMQMSDEELEDLKSIYDNHCF